MLNVGIYVYTDMELCSGVQFLYAKLTFRYVF